ncbi:MAG: hypothetical protein MJE66_20090, partial [Proteobacteria bacterium]|nr:hypothetical protein [Pseudomonadota bacterium]
WAGLAALALGCAAGHHTPEPYRSDAGRAAQLDARAHSFCRGSDATPRPLPAKPFLTDGCSRFPDGHWVACCVEHDVAYWCGGTASERLEADRAFRRCVARAASPALAGLMYWGVRVGGHPAFPSAYRWSYGREYWPWYADWREASSVTEPAPAADAR